MSTFLKKYAVILTSSRAGSVLLDESFDNLKEAVMLAEKHNAGEDFGTMDTKSVAVVVKKVGYSINERGDE